MRLLSKIKNSLFFRMVAYYKRKSTPKNMIPAALVHVWSRVCGEGTAFDFNHPKTYTQKIQWLKINDALPIKSDLTDKVKVRDWVKEQIGEQYLIPIIGIYDCFEDIDFNSLPNSFVIKMNHGSGWNIVVKDKTNFDIKKKIKRWERLDFSYWGYFEMHYSSITPKIIIEKYIEDSTGKLNDYKFLAFDGDVKYCWMDFDRSDQHRRNVYDLDWNLQPWNQHSFGNYCGKVDKPKNFEEMLRIAKVLAKGFNHVRVDLYNVDGDIYFGEMTFTNGSGLEKISPSEYDYLLGQMLKLPID